MPSKFGGIPVAQPDQASNSEDPRDFTNLYNTKLSPSEEAGFEKWAKKNNREKDSYDYDMRGAYRELVSGETKQAANGHFTDKFKKPNHPTFSDQSQYNGINGYTGGKWIETPEGISFSPGQSQEKLWSTDELRQYFNKVEPDVKLLSPANTAQKPKTSRFGGIPVAQEESRPTDMMPPAESTPPLPGVNPDVPRMDDQGNVLDFPQPEQPEPTTIGQDIAGAGETALTMATGATGGVAGTIGGTIKGILDEMAAGKFGTQEAADRIEQAAANGGAALTYAPRTQAGQEQVQAVGEALAPLAALGPLGNEIGTIAQGAKNIPAIARASMPVRAENPWMLKVEGQYHPVDIVDQSFTSPLNGKEYQRVVYNGKETYAPKEDLVAPSVAEPSSAQSLKDMAGNAASKAMGLIPSRAAKAVDDTGVGAAETSAGLQRRTTAESLPVPVKLTKGAETRNPDQLAFEKEQMKTEIGQPLRNRAEENNLQILQNFDSLIDDAGSGAVDVSSTGNKVIDTLSQGYKSARARTKAAYTAARASEEANAPVDLTKKVVLDSDNPDTSLIGYLNSKVSGIPSSAVTDAAKKYAVRIGIATEDLDGNLSPLPASVGKLEDFRKEMSGVASKTEPGQIRDETIIKKLVDAHTEPAAGPMFKAARAERTKQARKYENRAIVARLITNRKGSDDPKVAADQVFQKSVINSSPEEINFLRRVMLTSGSGGRQAWKDVQGALVNHIREESTKGLGTDSSGQPIVSPAKLNQVVGALDKNNRLDVVLGKQNARIVRDLNDVAKYVNTVPPGTLINNSGTAGTILAAIGEAGLLGASTGIPVPVLTGLKQIAKVVKNKRVKTKVESALNNLKPEKK